MAEMCCFVLWIETLAIVPARRGIFFLTEYAFMELWVKYEANRFTVELLTWSEEPKIGETLEYFAAKVGI